ncbi:TetR/AcrR family transcriptional regulator [Oceanobacillus massiliensis]|uniref:TetR/AcrR family transcriptional regulator n=1 Tax=Oceanobacillus massiliensis TaxID=1465765 RepID=UPI0002889701|nr:TetR/AcrR family transcriptional regulator [Oceanobacillus massiliensis]
MILEAATTLFLAKGYKEVSVDYVAEKCNVTKATVYYYYSTKAELFTQSLIILMERIRDNMQLILKEEPSLYSGLKKVAIAHLKATVDIDIEFFLREAKNALSADQIRQINNAEENMYDVVEFAFTEAMNKQEIPSVNPTFATHTYMALMKVGNYKDTEGNPIFPTVPETAEQLIGFFWNGIFPHNKKE